MSKVRNGFFALLLTALMWTPGCVVYDSPEKIAQVEETGDPFEPFNRYIFEVNIFLDEFMLKPASAWYQAALPQPAQDGVQRFLSNLRMPWTAINDFFQGRPERTYVALMRFLINSTAGVLGIFDVATGMGFPAHEEDLGQTLGVWGLPDMPYLVLPVFGPSNVRDAFGLLGDFYLDPVNVIARNSDDDTWIPSVRSGVTGIDSRARNDQVINDLKKQSTDFYATVRSVYRQRRDAQIKNRGEDPSNYPGPKLLVEPAGAHPFRPPQPSDASTPRN